MSLRKLIKTKLLENILDSPSISPIHSEDIKEVLHICSIIFSNVMSPNEVRGYIKSVAKWDISVKATIGDKIVGCYIFNEDPVMDQANCSKEDLSKYKKLKGIQGVALAVLPKFRGTGVGRLLRNYPLKLNYDYIWGQHLKGLHNVDNWMKFGRRLVGDCEDLYITLMDLKNNNLNERVEHNHIYQNKNHTCGPTCVEMIANYLGVKHDGGDAIETLCGCNSTTGTIDTGIKSALDSLGISNKQNTEYTDIDSAISLLNASIKDGNVFLMRTLTKGIKHWIIVYKFDGEKYYIADPWLGKITYSLNEIINIWKPRNFDGFSIYK